MEQKLTEIEWRDLDDLRENWGAFCSADFFEGSDTFEERMEAAGYIQLIPVEPEDLDEPFAAELGIEAGGMKWVLTDAGRVAISHRP